MTNNQGIEKHEAQAALDTLEQTTQDLNRMFMPSWPLSLISGFLFGALTLLSSLRLKDENYTAFLFAVICLFIGTYIYRVYSLKKQGKTLNVFMPKSAKGKRIAFIQAGFYAVVIIAANQMYVNGIEWGAYLGALLNALGLIFCVRKFPTLSY